MATVEVTGETTLAAAARLGGDVACLVLGAWGCGVFGNDPAIVASAFADALDDARWFERIVFAVYDRQTAAPVYQTFVRTLAP